MSDDPWAALAALQSPESRAKLEQEKRAKEKKEARNRANAYKSLEGNMGQNHGGRENKGNWKPGGKEKAPVRPAVNATAPYNFIPLPDGILPSRSITSCR